jgi:hypothetical protein
MSRSALYFLVYGGFQNRAMYTTEGSAGWLVAVAFLGGYSIRMGGGLANFLVCCIRLYYDEQSGQLEGEPLTRGLA